ncbi:major capsid protein, partial [uncultured marine virus]
NVPFFVDEALPGDTFSVSSTFFARMATPIFPIMDNLKMDSFFFAVPVRLLWDNWARMHGEQRNPGDSTDFVVPTMTSPPINGYDEGSLEDYLGLPTGIPDLEHSSLFHRAHNLIHNEWFRDENLTDSVINNVDDGPDSNLDYALYRRSKRHDYFTSALPWPQKGESISIPLGTRADVKGIGKEDQTFGASVNAYESGGTGQVQYLSATRIGDGSAGETHSMEEDPNNPGFPNIYADLTTATAATINQLRQSFQIQKMLERDARGGTRLTEVILAHFGVRSPDARMQRPEYLGGGSAPIALQQVASTVPNDFTENNTPQGNLAAYGIGVSSNNSFTKSFTEHCIILGYVNVRADITYQQGLNRMFSRSTRYDFYYPALSHIGEQAVLNKEIYAQGLPADEDVFGYQERHAEYRYKPSQISGAFRSSAAAPLDAWHLSQDFATLPVLDQTFIEENPPIDRVIAVPTEPHFLFDSYTSMKCARPMPVYGVPGLIDHF